MERQDHLRRGGEGARPRLRAGRHRGRLIALLLASLTGLAGPSSHADEDLIVAVAGPMTGRFAEFGKAMNAGATLAISMLERAGVGGRKVRMLVEDDGCDRERAVSLAQRLVARKVAVVVGHFCAGASIAAAPIYAAAGIVMISPGTTAPMFTDKRAGPTIFRLAPRDDAEGAVAGAYLARAFAGKRIAILHDRTVVGIDLANATKTAMTAAGLAEALYSGFIAGENDYGNLARDLRAARIDAVYLAAYPSETDMILAALRNDGQTTAVLASHLVATSEAGPQRSVQREGLHATALADIGRLADPARLPPNDPGSAYRRLKSNTVAAIEVWSKAVVNDVGSGLKLSIETAASLQSRTFATVLGDVRFDKKGDAMVPFFAVHAWKGGHLRPVPW